jgi:branched-chain amino acid transport system substrate-binding protein
MRKKRLLISISHYSLILGIASMLLMVGWIMVSQAQAASGKAPDKIIFGNPIALSGPYSPGAMMTQIRSYDLWKETVNAKGGIYVKEYGKRIPVEIIRYDDKSDLGTTVKLTEKLLL